MKAIIPILFAILIFGDICGSTFVKNSEFIIQWEKSYGSLWWWSARYEGSQPVGDADNDGKNELLIGGRDPFMRVMKWDERKQTYYEQAKIVDPVFGIGYSFFGISQPFGSATGFGIGDIDNDGKNEIGVAWGRHFSFFEWNGFRYKKEGMYVVYNGQRWGTTLDCIVGDYDNDGMNEVIVTGSFNNVPSLVAIRWDGNKFIEEAKWGNEAIYFPWIADVDNDGKNEVIVGHGRELVLLKWEGEKFISNTIEKFQYQVFGCVAKDSNGDGINEIHVTFYAPRLCIYRWNGSAYEKLFDTLWQGEEDTIEAIDVGNVDNDEMPEVCVGTDKVHILQWKENRYEEEYLISDTYGLLAVTCVGDFDNDGKNEINAGAVGVSRGEDYKSWIFKYSGL
ncbi:MAG: hypothetical protein QW519_01235 [Candidatus Thermoplasmatota archaeon]